MIIPPSFKEQVAAIKEGLSADVDAPSTDTKGIFASVENAVFGAIFLGYGFVTLAFAVAVIVRVIFFF